MGKEISWIMHALGNNLVHVEDLEILECIMTHVAIKLLFWASGGIDEPLAVLVSLWRH